MGNWCLNIVGISSNRIVWSTILFYLVNLFVCPHPPHICFFNHSTTLLSSGSDMPAAWSVWWFWCTGRSGNGRKYCNFPLSSSFFVALTSCFISSRYDLILCCSFFAVLLLVFFSILKRGEVNMFLTEGTTGQSAFFVYCANFLDFKTQSSKIAEFFRLLDSAPC